MFSPFQMDVVESDLLKAVTETRISSSALGHDLTIKRDDCSGLVNSLR